MRVCVVNAYRFTRQKHNIQLNSQEVKTTWIAAPRQESRDHLFSMCEKHIENTLMHIEGTLKAHWSTLGKKTHWKALRHIRTHCTLQHIGDCAASSNVPPMCPILNVQETHWKHIGKHWRHIEMCYNAFIITPHQTPPNCVDLDKKPVSGLVSVTSFGTDASV